MYAWAEDDADRLVAYVADPHRHMRLWMRARLAAAEDNYQLQVAVHEASHGVIATMHGCRVRHISIVPDGRSAGYCRIVCHEGEELQSYLTLMVAGIIGEREISGNSAASFASGRGGESDAHNIRLRLQQEGLACGEDVTAVPQVQAAIEDTRRLVRQLRVPIVLIALGLLELARLDGETVRLVVFRTGGMRWREPWST
jgi:hypothetical protein